MPVILVAVSAVPRLALCARYLSGDETRILKNVIHFFTHHTLMPTHFKYPTLFSYISAIPIRIGAFLLTARGVIRSLPQLHELHSEDSILPILPARLTSASFGILTILVLFKIGEKFYNRNTGLYAAAILALSNMHMFYSGYAYPSATMTFFAVCSLLFALSALHGGSMIHYILAGLFAGLTAATKYNGALIMLVILCAHIVKVEGKKQSLSFRYHRAAIFSIISAVGAFIIGTPGWLINPKAFWLGLMYERRHVTSGDLWDAGAPYIRQAWSMWNWEKTTAILFALGLIYALYRRKKTDIVLLITCVICLIYMGGLGKKSTHYIIFMLPVLALLSARMLSEAREAVRRTVAPSLGNLLIVIALAWPAYNAQFLTRQQMLADNRTIAQKWIQENIEDGAKIVIDWAYVPKINIPSPEESYGRKGRNNLPQGPGSEKARRHLRVAIYHRTEYLLNADAKYLITSSGCYERYIDPPPPPRSSSTKVYYEVRDFYSALLFDPEVWGWRLRRRFDEGKGPVILLFERTNDSDLPRSME